MKVIVSCMEEKGKEIDVEPSGIDRLYRIKSPSADLKTPAFLGSKRADLPLYRDVFYIFDSFCRIAEDEEYIAIENIETQGYTEGYKLGYTGLRWL